MINVQDLIAVEGNIGIEFLGNLTWFTISDMKVTREKLAEIFKEVGLNEACLPNPINPRDAFRKATAKAEVSDYPLGEDKRLNVLIREVKCDKEIIVRQLVREVVDSKNVRLEYLPLANIELVGWQGEKVTISEFVSKQRMYEPEKEVLEQIENRYEEEKIYYNGQNIRDTIMRILRSVSAVAVRPSGGVYFVPKAYEPTVRALQGFVKALAELTKSQSQFWTVPVIKAEEQKEMLKQSLEEQVKGEAETLLEEMTRLLKTEGVKIRQKTAQKYMEKVRGLAALVKEYEEMLETRIITAQATLELVKTQAMNLLEKVEIEVV